MKSLYWKFMAAFFRAMRPWFLADVDPNEDFNCMECGKPVLRRYLFCSVKCEESAEWFSGPKTHKPGLGGKRMGKWVDKHSVKVREHDSSWWVDADSFYRALGVVIQVKTQRNVALLICLGLVLSISLLLSSCSSAPKPERHRCPHPVFGFYWCDEPYGGRK